MFVCLQKQYIWCTLVTSLLAAQPWKWLYVHYTQVLHISVPLVSYSHLGLLYIFTPYTTILQFHPYNIYMQQGLVLNLRCYRWP